MAYSNSFHSSYQALGLASDSILPVLLISVIVAVIIAVVGIVLIDRDGENPGIFRRKPLMVPSVAFIISMLLMITVAPIPMAQYQGMNETHVWFSSSETQTFRVYDGEIYTQGFIVRVTHSLEAGESLEIDIHAYLEDTPAASTTLILNGSIFDDTPSGQVSVGVAPGLYSIDLSLTSIQNGHVTSFDEYIYCIISQPLAEGMSAEVMAWDNYKFFMMLGAFGLILGACMCGKEDKTRISRERVDKEPPRDGEIYTRRWS